MKFPYFSGTPSDTVCLRQIILYIFKRGIQISIRFTHSSLLPTPSPLLKELKKMFILPFIPGYLI